MEVSSGPRVTGWQGAYVPQLKFRNPLPPEHGLEPQNEHQSELVQKPAGPSIREIRLSMSQQGQQEGPNPSPPRSLMPPSVENFSRTPPNKKKSLFGGLFAVKEPTQVALNQVAAQIMAQHGSTTAGKVPNVSMEKMPQHVPKVNAKWDGIPDAIKQRERRVKERARTATRDSMTNSTLRSRSSEQSRRPLETRASYNSGDSSGDRTKSRQSNSRKHESYAPNPHRFYAQSVNSSGDLAAQQRPEEEDSVESRPSSAFSHPPSLQSASSKSVGDAGVFPDDIHAHKKAPATHRRSLSQPKSERKRGSLGLNFEAVPEQTSLAIRPPPERSAVAPVPRGHDAGTGRPYESASRNAKSDVVPTMTPKTPLKQNPAFLAGEAQEFQVPDDDDDQHDMCYAHGAAPRPPARFADLEKRPDSSRERLGLRASMVVKGDRTWDPRSDYPYDRPPSADDRTNAQLKPKKTISKAFGTLLKREM